MLLQLSARAHEIVIVVSLSQIIWYMVRHELQYGESLPLGQSFNKFESFKKDFHASLGYVRKGRKPLKRTGVVGLLVVSGFIALSAEPAIAVLSVSKNHAYPAG